MTLEDVWSFLASIPSRPPRPISEEVEQFIRETKANAVGRGDEATAKRLWCLQEALSIQNLYLGAFEKLKQHEFYHAWCELEKIENKLANLDRHETLFWPEFRLDFINIHVERWQSLFPYKLFFSPGLVGTEKKCSICGAVVTPRKQCGHRTGEIYLGEQCFRIVTKFEPLEISVVTRPAQKYSVIFLSDPETGGRGDHYDYRLLEYLVSALRKPFDGWDVRRTIRIQLHSKFSHLTADDRCPCGSGDQYQNCCRHKDGVEYPHFEFAFEIPPPPEVPSEGLLAPRAIR
jgi:hypothetical protein